MRAVWFLTCLLFPMVCFADEGETEGDGMAARVEVPREFVDVTRATVLASPDFPAAMRSNLPRAPEPIVWPLPEGPVVILGLPTHDDGALAVMEAFGLLDDPDELAGGYDLWAWEADGRSIVVLLAADAAAMFAARFEFEQSASSEMINPSMRKVDMKGGDGSSAVLVRVGHRQHRPVAPIRGWAPSGSFSLPDAFACAGAHINQLWLRADHLKSRHAYRAVRRVRDFGVAVTLWGEIPGERTELERIKAMGVHAVAMFQSTELREAPTFEAVASWMAPDPVFWIGDATPRTPHLRPVTRADGTPLFRMDTWNLEGQPAYVPTTPPPGQSGSILVGGAFALERLAALWDTDRPVTDHAAAIERCFGVATGDAVEYLKQAAAKLRTTEPTRPWHRPIANHIERAATPDVLLVPIVPAAASISANDSTLDEAAWAFAARRQCNGFEVLVLSDGSKLHVGVRLANEESKPLRIRVRTTDRKHPAGSRVAPSPLKMPSGHRTRVYQRTPDDLQGATHAGRVLDLYVGLAGVPGQSIPLVIVP